MLSEDSMRGPITVHLQDRDSQDKATSVLAPLSESFAAAPRLDCASPAVMK